MAANIFAGRVIDVVGSEARRITVSKKMFLGTVEI
jgi:hypothetical protein